MTRALRAPQRLLILLTFFLPACGSSLSSVSGDVTYEGQALESGRIDFLPADGKGQPAGSTIAAGKYEVAGLVPGLKVVQITAVKVVPFARSSEEMARRAQQDKDKGDGTGLIDPADIIPPDAEGNNLKIELKPGRQTLDFPLTKPGTKKAP
jgi:hypothetical protein